MTKETDIQSEEEKARAKMPHGYERVTCGTLSIGDLVWNVAKQDFDVIETKGNAPVYVCYFACRRRDEPERFNCCAGQPDGSHSHYCGELY